MAKFTTISDFYLLAGPAPGQKSWWASYFSITSLLHASSHSWDQVPWDACYFVHSENYARFIHLKQARLFEKPGYVERCSNFHAKTTEKIPLPDVEIRE
jgi:cytochrome c1